MFMKYSIALTLIKDYLQKYSIQGLNKNEKELLKNWYRNTDLTPIKR